MSYRQSAVLYCDSNRKAKKNCVNMEKKRKTKK